MKKETKIAIVVGILALGWIASLFDKKEDAAAEPAATEAAAPPAKTKFDAYGISCQVAREKYGKCDNEFMSDVDLGNGQWIISGHSDIPGRRIYWTSEVKYDNATDKWDIIGWAER